ncbi:hypothetical protein TNCV_1257971 [Trichonephila clavipes]|nr:hypothetical protein TNCV_1257971 [Trichonephila clavipes]
MMNVLGAQGQRLQSKTLPKFVIREFKKKKGFREADTRAAENKSWRVLIKPNCVSDSLRAAAVAEFRFLTGHDCLCAHLYCNIVDCCESPSSDSR